MDYPHPERLSRKMVTGKVVSGDSYVSQRSIGHIDFLKIDVEGMEDGLHPDFYHLLVESVGYSALLGRCGLLPFERRELARRQRTKTHAGRRWL